ERRRGERGEVGLARRQQLRGLGRAARERHLERIGLAVVLKHVALEIVEPDQGLHLVRADATTVGVTDIHRRRAHNRRQRGGCGGASGGGTRAQKTAPRYFSGYEFYNATCHNGFSDHLRQDEYQMNSLLSQPERLSRYLKRGLQP